jgi:hypothetical protein
VAGPAWVSEAFEGFFDRVETAWNRVVPFGDEGSSLHIDLQWVRDQCVNRDFIQ